MKITRGALCVAAVAVLAGLACAKATVKPTRTVLAGGPQQKPDRVLVYNFALTEEEVHLNRSPVAATARLLTKDPEESDEMKLGHVAAAALSNTLVAELNDIGIVAARGEGPPPDTGEILLLHGEFLDIDEGNRLARSVVGFGAGATELHTRVEASWVREGELERLGEVRTEAKGSKKPGLVVPIGVGAATGVWMGVAVMGAGTAILEALGPLEGNIKDTAEQIALFLGQRYVERGWLPRDAID